MPQDFSGQNLRGRSFKGQNLEGVNFSDADIRSADFTGTNLRNANFSNATAGLQKRWAIFFVCVSWLLSVVLGFFSVFIGTGITYIFNYSTSVENQVFAWTVFIVVIVVFLVILRQGLISALTIVGAFGISIAIAGFLTVIGLLAGAMNGFVSFVFVGSLSAYIALAFLLAIIIAGGIAITGAFVFAIAFTSGGTIAVSGALCIALTMSVLVGFGTPFNFHGAFGIAFRIAFAIVFANAGVLFSAYIAWRAIKGDEKYSLIHNIAVAFAAFGGTSFHKADLTDANFTVATLKTTDFRKANLTRTCFYQVQKLDYVRPGTSYLQNPELRQLLITREAQGKNFENQILQGLNLSKVNFAYANLINTTFYQSSLKEANLEGALLVRAQFESTDLTGATLTSACIEDWVVTKTTKLYGVKCKYIFMKLTEKGDKRDQMPPKGEFKNDDFILFVQSILDTIKLYHERDVNPNLALYVLQSLSEDYQCTFEIVKVEKRGKSGAIIEVKIPGNLNEEQLKETYYKKYNQSLKLYMSDPNKKLIASTNIENITVHKGFVIGGDVSNSNIADTINQGDTTMTGDRNINTDGGNYNERIERDYIQGNYYAAGQPQSLAQAAAEIQLLLKQLEQTYPTTTTSQQMVVAAEAINRIESNPTLKKRVINAVKEGGLAAFEKAIDNPAGAFIVGAIKGWQEVEAED